MRINVVNMMITVGVVIGIHAEEGNVETNENDFELLCGVMRAATGLWYTLRTNAEYFRDDNEEQELNKEIDKIFFGEKESVIFVSLSELPKNFKDAQPKRSEICESNKDSSGMPSASSSMASAFLCLCTSKTDDGERLCELNGNNGVWADGGRNVKDVFEKVWGISEVEEGVFKKCDANYELLETLEQERQNLEGNITKIESTLTEKNGVLCKKGTTCDTSDARANITRNSTWLERLKKIVKQAQDLIQLQAQKENYVSETEVPANTAASASPPKPAPTPEPVSPEQTPRQEARKAAEEESKHVPQPEQEPKQKPAAVPQKEEEDTYPAPEPNEASGSYLTSSKWLIWAALLI